MKKQRAAKRRKPLGKRQKIALLSSLCALLLIGALLLTLWLTGVFDKPPFEKSPYEKIDLSHFVTLPTEKYQGATFEYTSPDEITDKTVKDYISYLKLNYIPATEKPDGGLVTEGDTVSIWYRGLIDGKEFVGGSNLASSVYKLLIGSGAFIDGFEDALIGKDTSKYPIKFYTTSSRSVQEDDVVFISYTYTYTETVTENGTDKTEEKSGTAGERIDLASPREGLPEALIADLKGKAIGTKLTGSYTGKYDYDADLTAEDVTIKDVTILKTINKNGTNPPLSITVTFPADYGKDETTGEVAAVAGKEAIFEVWFESLSRAEITASFLKNSFGLTYDAMKNYINKTEGTAGLSEDEQMVKAFPTYLKEKFLVESRDETVYSNKVSALWNQLFKDAAISEVPAALTQHEYDIMYQQASEYYAANTSNFKDKADCFTQIWGLPGKDTSEDGYLNELRALAEEEARNRMVFYFIADQLGVSVTAKEYKDELAAAVQYYQQQYNSTSITEEDTLEACGGQESFVFNILYQKLSKILVEKNSFTPVAASSSSSSSSAS